MINSRIFALPFALFLALNSFAQTAKYSHSHNDYNNPTPFYKAFYAGLNSIEADIFLVDGKLLVAHDKKAISAGRTLKELYLDPVIYAFQKDTSRRLCLLIDIKGDHKATLSRLIEELKPLTDLLMTDQHPGRLKILISGNRPTPAEYKNYPGFLFFDDDLIFPHSKMEWDRVGQVSLDFSRYSKWNGTGSVAKSDEQHIKHLIDSVHVNTGKLVRFWGAPDLPKSWNIQIKLGADVIGTDHIEELQNYLVRKKLCRSSNEVMPAK